MTKGQEQAVFALADRGYEPVVDENYFTERKDNRILVTAAGKLVDEIRLVVFSHGGYAAEYALVD